MARRKTRAAKKQLVIQDDHVSVAEIPEVVTSIKRRIYETDTIVEGKKRKIAKFSDDINFGCNEYNQKGQIFNVKVCSWCVEGIEKITANHSIDYLIAEDADIIAIQETKCVEENLSAEMTLPGYRRFYFDGKPAGLHGVSLYAKIQPLNIVYGLKNTQYEDEGRIITAEFENFHVINVCMPVVGEDLESMIKRDKWCVSFNEYAVKLNAKKPVIICGNFNVAHQDIDVNYSNKLNNYAGVTSLERKHMNDLLINYVDAFRELYPMQEDTCYTFWPRIYDNRCTSGYRFDYFIVSREIRDGICDIVTRKSITASRHCPMVLYANFSKMVIRILVKTANQIFPLLVQLYYTGMDVKTCVKYILGIEINDQCLLSRGKLLKDDKTLFEYKIKEGSVLHLVFTSHFTV